MADRTSAGIFSDIFVYLAKQKKPDIKFAKKLWRDSKQFDFDNAQLECDDALIKLGLAKLGLSKEYPEDGEITLYLGDDY